MSRQGGMKGWERKEDYSGEKVYYQRYEPESELIDPRFRGNKIRKSINVDGVFIRGNSEEGYVVIMDRRDGEGNPSREFSSLEDAEDEAKRVLKDINEDRLFRETTSEEEVLSIIVDIASDKVSDDHWYYDHLNASKEIEKLAKFASRL